MTETDDTRPKKGRWKRHPVTRTLTGILLVFTPVPLTMVILSQFVERSARIVWPQLLVGAVSFLAYRFFVRRVEKRPLTEFNTKGALRELSAGLLIGALLVCSLFGILALAGAFRLEGYDGMSVEIVRRTATGILVGMHEEMLLRGIVLTIMEASLGSGLALVGSAILFGLGHLPSEGVTAMAIVNTTAAGITLGAAYMATRRLWLPIGIHIAWNITIGQVFSAIVSGHGTERGLLRGTLTGPEWLIGGQFGVESSVVALMLDVVASTVLLRIAAKRGNLVVWPRKAKATLLDPDSADLRDDPGREALLPG